MNSRRISRGFLLCFLLIAMLTTSAYAVLTIKVTYSSGGTVTPASDTVQLENGQILVNDSSPVTLLIIPDDGYSIHSVFRDGKQMDISGDSQQSITVIPKADVDIQVVFLPTYGVEAPVDEEEDVPEKSEISPQKPDTNEQENTNLPDSSVNGVDSNPQEIHKEIDWHKISFAGAIAGAVLITILIMIRMFRKRIKDE